MKIAPTKSNGYDNRKEKDVLLPLTGKPKLHTKGNSCSFSLRSDPADPDSQTYKMTILRLEGGESVRTLIQWQRDITKILTGLALATGAAEFAVITTILAGTPQTAFELHVTDAATAALLVAAAAAADVAAATVIRNAGFHPHITKQMVAAACLDMIAKAMPKKVLARVKRHMRRDVRKPADMTIRDFYQHLVRMNELEVSALPLYALLQKFNTDELIDHSKYIYPD